MSARQVGVAPYRLHEHPRAGEIDATARWVLTVMAMFVGRGERYAENPTCFAAQSEIAERAALTDRTVRRAQRRLRELGVIESAGRVGEGMNCTVRWRLPLLAVGGRPDTESDKSRPDTESDKHPDTESDKHPDTESDNPPDSERPQGSERGRSAAAPRTASADAPATATTTARASAQTIAEIASMDGCSVEHTQRWAEDMFQGRKITNPDRYLIQCQKRGDGPSRRSPATGTQQPPATRRRRQATPQQRRDAAHKVLAGHATPAEVAADNGVSTSAVYLWVTNTKSDLIRRVLSGTASVADAASEAGCPASTVQGWVGADRAAEAREREQRARAVARWQAERRDNVTPIRKSSA